jgi:hypothetical protein
VGSDLACGTIVGRPGVCAKAIERIVEIDEKKGRLDPNGLILGPVTSWTMYMVKYGEILHHTCASPHHLAISS